MSSGKKYFLKWKGEISGPFSADELRSMQTLGHIGLLHEIKTDGGSWTLLKNFEFDCAPSEPAAESHATARSLLRSQSFQYAVYALCGASFVSAYFYVAALALAGVLYAFGEKRAAASAFWISTGIALAGLAFFRLVYPVLAR